MRIFLDANILFSASRPKSRIRLLLDYLVSNKHELISNDYAREEAYRNAISKKFSSHESFMELFTFVSITSVLSPDPIPDLAEKDQPILRGALGCNADYLLTSDRKDFGAFMKKNKYQILVGTPEHLAEFLKL